MREMVCCLKECNINETTIIDIIKFYTREAGVRNLEVKFLNYVEKAPLKLLKATKKILPFLLIIYKPF